MIDISFLEDEHKKFKNLGFIDPVKRLIKSVELKADYINGIVRINYNLSVGDERAEELEVKGFKKLDVASLEALPKPSCTLNKLMILKNRMDCFFLTRGNLLNLQTKTLSYVSIKKR